MARKKTDDIDKKSTELYEQIFEDLKRGISILDPVSFAENYLSIDGKPFDLSGSGWRYMAEIYRNVASQVENKNAKPIVILKGRQVGATVMAMVLSLYFVSSGLYGSKASKPPIRVMHLFPALLTMSQYAKEKLEPMMNNSKDSFVLNKSLKKDKTAVSAAEDTITQKHFIGYNTLRVDSVGKSGDRIRGTSQDVLLYDECLVGNTYIETDTGKMSLKNIYERFVSGKDLPLVKTFNEKSQDFEYKRILNAWNRGAKPIVQVKLGKNKIRCTDNHPFLTERGWLQVKDLQLGDLVIGSPGNSQYVHALNDDQLQIVIGSFLGDGNLQSHKDGRYRLRVLHGAAQEDYCRWKASMFGCEPRFVPHNGKYDKPGWWFSTKSFSLPGPLDDGVKTSVPQWLIDRMDARALAIWYMDDGAIKQKGKSYATLHTCSFDEDSQSRLVMKLRSMGIDCKYAMRGGYFRIIISKRGCDSLLPQISAYMHDNLSYKARDLSQYKSYVWDNQFKKYSHYIVDDVVDLHRQEEVFDIEVEDNHNFIVTSGRGSKLLGGPSCHNCQDMTRAAIENSQRVLTATPYGAPTKGVQLYFGTPKQSGSYFWSLWQSSDQRFYQLRCVNCDHYFQLYNLDDDSWLETWVSGQTVKCPKCAYHQDKRVASDGGRWIATKPDAKYIGYHHNMMLSPLYTKENVMEYFPKTNPSASERAWKNETLGEFYSGGGTPLTFEDIVTHALDDTRGTAKSISDTKGKIVCMGMDWGDKAETDDDVESSRGKSYSTAVIVSIGPDGIITIENAVRLKKNDFEYKTDAVQRLLHNFKVQTTVADYMWGQDVVRHMQYTMSMKNRFLGCINSGNLTKMLSYDPKFFRVTANKDMMIEEIFSMIKQGKIKFPAKGLSFESLRWLMDHCTSMEVETRVKDGNAVKKYVKGTGPNDGLMALMYAIIAYKYVVTGGFEVADQSLAEESSERPMPVLGYITRI